MATQGRAAKSASGASMSKYDVEVEGRLKKLEEALGSASAPAADGDRLAALEARLDRVVEALRIALPGVAKGL